MMKTRSVRCFALSAALAFVSGPLPGSERPYGANSYVGDVSVQIVRSDGASAHDRGTGSAQFIDGGSGDVQLVVVGNIKAKGDAGFAVPGRLGEEGWHASADGVSLRVAPDGKISGGGRTASQRLRFEGVVTPRVFDMKVDLRLTEGNDRFPAGTAFVFHYRLAAMQKNERVGGEGKARGKDCERIVWRTRNIAGFGGGPMQMIRVPECVNW